MLFEESMMITFVHLILALVLFFLINWLGKHSVSVGYMNLSIFFKEDSAPAFNFLLRSLTPIMYLFITSSILYWLNFDAMVNNIWLVVVYYFVFRIIFNLLMSRARLLNWSYQFSLALITIYVSFFSYDKFIKNKETLLPNFSSMTNELWIIIALFVYATMNNVRLSPKAAKKRKDAYLDHMYKYFLKKYSAKAKDKVATPELEPLVYAIMIYENFNRPLVARAIEHLFFSFGKSKTLGIMQVTTDRRISDEESLEMAIDKLNHDYEASRVEEEANSAKWRNHMSEEEVQKMLTQSTLRSTTRKYNPSDNYVREVMDVHYLIVKKYYSDLSESTTPSIHVEEI